MKIILASASPRRRELLAAAGIEYEAMVSDEEEVVEDGLGPEEIVLTLSKQKAENVEKLYLSKGDGADKDYLIIGSDTIVYHIGQVLGKPKSEDNAKAMLKNLSNSTHNVYTGVTLVCVKNGKREVNSFFEKTDVTMTDIDDKAIDRMVASGEPMDKAGAYAIQGMAGVYITKINGDYNSVIGLPVGRVINEIKARGVSI